VLREDSKGRTASDAGRDLVWRRPHRNTIRPRKVGIVGRVERYADPSRAIVQTNLPATFAVSGASLGLTSTPSHAFSATEARGLRVDQPVYPLHPRRRVFSQ